MRNTVTTAAESASGPPGATQTRLDVGGNRHSLDPAALVRVDSPAPPVVTHLLGRAGISDDELRSAWPTPPIEGASHGLIAVWDERRAGATATSARSRSAGSPVSQRWSGVDRLNHLGTSTRIHPVAPAIIAYELKDLDRLVARQRTPAAKASRPPLRSRITVDPRQTDRKPTNRSRLVAAHTRPASKGPAPSLAFANLQGGDVTVRAWALSERRLEIAGNISRSEAGLDILIVAAFNSFANRDGTTPSIPTSELPARLNRSDGAIREAKSYLNQRLSADLQENAITAGEYFISDSPAVRRGVWIDLLECGRIKWDIEIPALSQLSQLKYRESTAADYDRCRPVVAAIPSKREDLLQDRLHADEDRAPTFNDQEVAQVAEACKSALTIALSLALCQGLWNEDAGEELLRDKCWSSAFWGNFHPDQAILAIAALMLDGGDIKMARIQADKVNSRQTGWQKPHDAVAGVRSVIRQIEPLYYEAGESALNRWYEVEQQFAAWAWRVYGEVESAVNEQRAPNLSGDDLHKMKIHYGL